MRLKSITLLLLLLSIYSVSQAQTARTDLNLNRRVAKVKEARLFAAKHNFNTAYCMLVDMGQPSGKKRFLLWDFSKKDTVVTGLVSHGCGVGPWSGVWSKDKPVFSDAPDSHCTALGKYRIGARAYSQWGVHVKYLLIGLEQTNKSALKRQVVFHSWDAVPERDIYPDGTPEGWGCPAISNNTMKKVDAVLRHQKKPVLLWIYN